MKRNKMLAGGLIGLLGLLPVTAKNTHADLIQVANISSVSGSSSASYLSNQEGGALGYDINDHSAWAPRPPGSPDDWLRVYSDQWNQFYSISNTALNIDNRPFSGEDANHPFPLVLDTQGPGSITSSNNYIRFNLESGIDEGREQYQWSMNLFNGATFSDGTTNKSGLWNLADSSTYNLPYYNMSNVQGTYGTLNVTPIPEPFTLSLLGVGAGLAVLGFRLRRNGFN